ncbi:hypothetical protein F4780DRAFT_750753 [Xylariomycetidae sp. FL0641]|nr:hypothetical protein F4780DRAFT_750753 [Xylariomycetidae sp. FL0641]
MDFKLTNIAEMAIRHMNKSKSDDDLATTSKREHTARSDISMTLRRPSNDEIVDSGADKGNATALTLPKLLHFPCTMCDRLAKKYCPECCGPYCSAECYRKDWPVHKLLCKSFPEFLAHKRPTPWSNRVIVFPADSPRPRFAWLELNTDSAANQANICRMTGHDVKRPSVQMPHRHVGKDLVYCSHNIHDKDAAKTLPINQSVMTLGKPGHLTLQWGTQLFFGRGGKNTGEGFAIDTDTRDLRVIVDYYRARVFNPCVVEEERFPLCTTFPQGASRSGRPRHLEDHAVVWPAVKINCEGDHERLKDFCAGKELEVVEDVKVLSIDILYDQQMSSIKPACLLPTMCELPWIYREVVDNLSHPDVEDNPWVGVFNYVGRIFASQIIDIDDDGGVHAPADNHCGTIIVMDKTGGPIHSSHVLCFFAFAEQKLRQLAKANNPGDEKAWQQTTNSFDRMREIFTKASFLEFWQKWTLDRVDLQGFDKDLLVSPYDREEATRQEKLVALYKHAIIQPISRAERREALTEALQDLHLL